MHRRSSNLLESDQYLVRFRVRWRIPRAVCWVDVYDDSNAKILQSDKVEIRKGKYLDLLEQGFRLHDIQNERKPVLSINYPSDHDKRYIICDIHDLVRADRVASLGHHTSLELADWLGEEVGEIHDWRGDWQIYDREGGRIGLFSEKMKWGVLGYNIYLGDDSVGRIVQRKNPFRARFDVMLPETGKRAPDRRLVVAFASMMFPLALRKNTM